MTAGEISRTRQLTHEGMQRGIRHLAAGDFTEALAEFDSVAGIRSQWPWQEDPELAWMLAATWINRADALQGAGSLQKALASLDLGISAMEHVPADAAPGVRERLILAWLKRAELCASCSDPLAAGDAFRKAESLLVEIPGNRELAMMLTANRARFLLDQGEVITGLADARRAVEMSRSLEAAGDASGSILVRSILCRALAALLDAPEHLDLTDDWIAEATDAVEESLGFARRTADDSGTIADLIRYGARIYRTCQPQFLAPFLKDVFHSGSALRKDERLLQEMRNELLLAQVEVEKLILLRPHDDAHVARQAKTLQAIQATLSFLGRA
ncbi:hypothetical protein OKA04_22660 [Luteolibacter flavescens]|uniref:Tetratricopeptide repeat protein n=1 Tax=Luteolibacter flavescens TaxID=1859460 RepID=A0ABT3FWE5_9BACT|nr:hypothetical protein [Luteolibacter flavescens]MCW1887556.1 hypothetical protein [Luteolibacter flavescens]